MKLEAGNGQHYATCIRFMHMRHKQRPVSNVIIQRCSPPNRNLDGRSPVWDRGYWGSYSHPANVMSGSEHDELTIEHGAHDQACQHLATSVAAFPHNAESIDKEMADLNIKATTTIAISHDPLFI